MVDAMNTIRLILTPEPVPTDTHPAPLRFEATLDGAHVVTSHQPLADGARVLLARGWHPDTPVTIRHAGSVHDSFAPRPIGEWARWTYTDGRRLLRQEWRPRADMPASVIRDGVEAHGTLRAVPSPYPAAVTLSQEAP
jgi:hypothetical protein